MSLAGDSRVMAGFLTLITATILTTIGNIKQEHLERPGDLSVYWHFVDVVWVLALTVVYILGR